MKNTLLIFAIALVLLIPNAYAINYSEEVPKLLSVIDIDRAHHHLGDNFKEELTPSEPEGTTYTKTFNLDSVSN